MPQNLRARPLNLRLRHAAVILLALGLGLSILACTTRRGGGGGDDENNANAGTNNANAGTNNANAGTNNANAGTNNANAGTNNANAGTNNVNAGTNNVNNNPNNDPNNNPNNPNNNPNNDALVECQTSCSALVDTCRPDFLAAGCSEQVLAQLVPSCQGACEDPDARAQITAAANLPCDTVVPLAIDNFGLAEVCGGGPAEICDNIADDDGDGDADCEDGDCAAAPACRGVAEICDNIADDDEDGDADCDDADCMTNPICGEVEPTPIPQPGNTIELAGSLDITDPTWSRPDQDCRADNSPGRPYDTFALINNTGARQTITVTASWPADGYLHIFEEPFDLVGFMGCLDGNDDFTSTSDSQLTEIPIAAGQTLLVVASTFSAGIIGPYTLTLTTNSPP